MSNRQSYCSRTLVQIATVALAIAVGGCGVRNERILEYEAVTFIETTKGSSSFFCSVEDPANSRVQVTRPDGERRKVREFDLEWVAAGAAEEEVSDSANYSDGVRRSSVDRKWIAAAFDDGVPSSIYLRDGSSVQGNGSDNLKLPANEKQIRKAFGRPKKVYRRAGFKPSFGAIERKRGHAGTFCFFRRERRVAWPTLLAGHALGELVPKHSPLAWVPGAKRSGAPATCSGRSLESSSRDASFE